MPGGWGGRNKSFALGRLKAQEMNQTELAFALYLDQRQRTGEVIWWRFQGLTLLLAHGEQSQDAAGPEKKTSGVRYTPDFAAMCNDGFFHLYEIKGRTMAKVTKDGEVIGKKPKAFFQNDARMKIEIASEQYPFKFFVCYPEKGGGWNVTEV